VDTVASGYIYFGYAISSEAEFLALVDAVRKGADLEQNIAVEKGKGTAGSSTLYRMRNKLDEVLAADGVLQTPDPGVLARIPVLMERPRDGYAWVMFANYHMARLPYPSVFPLTPAVIDAVGAASAASK
jgi:hypothetical protein